MTSLLKVLAAAGMLLNPAMSFAEDAHHPPSGTEEAPAVETAPKEAAPDAMPGGHGGDAGGMTMGGDMMKMMKEMMGSHATMMRGMMSTDGMTDGPMGQMMSPEHVEGRIAFLRMELKVTDGQEPLWEAVAEALRESARASEHMMQQGAASQTLPSALEGRERSLSAHLEAVRRLRAAVEPFYAALDETQKATADKLMEPMGMM
ncbi:Spy/CpxP family protein refolding chaperone [Mesorhizobium sp. KR9-304]|uniref:Spy/CpxP family protein refolding chaperone n=1 Tax=Mesorhizobium sp. KR9-304 TaxID=3156614 RepID=UPI0032B34B90